jgi:hypothetical protein
MPECYRCGNCCHVIREFPCGGKIIARCVHLTEYNLCERHDDPDRPDTCKEFFCHQKYGISLRKLEEGEELKKIRGRLKSINILHKFD